MDVEGSFQSRVRPWMIACFGEEVSADRMERGDRLLEEVFELLQSGDYPRERIRALEDYTWSRPKGEPYQEAGGVMVTMAAYCLPHGLDMHEAGELELARVWTKVEQIRAKQESKPKGSPLPIALPALERSPEAPAPKHVHSGSLLKQLEWSQNGDGSYLAQSSLGTYEIKEDDFAGDGEWILTSILGHLGDFDELQQAMNAAQVDFRKRVDDAFVSPPGPTKEMVSVGQDAALKVVKEFMKDGRILTDYSSWLANETASAAVKAAFSTASIGSSQ